MASSTSTRRATTPGVKPIIGSELYMAYERRTSDRRGGARMDDSGGEAEGGRKAYYHLTTLAENQAGYKNLIQLSSRAFMEGYYRKPKVDWEILERALRGDHRHDRLPRRPRAAGADATATSRRRVSKAGRLQDIFGRDNLFVELQDHGIPEQHRTNPQLLEIARKLKRAAARDQRQPLHPPRDADGPRRASVCPDRSLMSDPDRFKFHGDQHYLKSADEMRDLFREVEACDNSLWIAERADVEIEFGKPLLPDFPLPEGFADDAAYLRHLTFAGARERWGDELPEAVVERLAYELKVIGDMGFSSYFLIIWDLIRHARDANIRVGPGPGLRGGLCGRLLPAHHRPRPDQVRPALRAIPQPQSAVSMPDIDMDFDSRYRDEMIRYAAERYGRDRVAQIVTFSTIKARAAVRDAARVLGYPYSVGDKVAKAMPPLIMGRDTPLYACLEEHPKYLDGYKMATDLRADVQRGSRRPRGDRSRPWARRAASRGRYPRGRGGDHQGPADRLPADPTQTRGRR